MEETEKIKVTAKEWMTFIIFTVVLLAIGFLTGVSVGRKHPSAAALDKELKEIDVEVQNLRRAYDANRKEYELGIEMRDSIICALTREIAKCDDAQIPVKLNINYVNEDGSK